MREAQLRLTLPGVGVAEIGEHVAGAAGDDIVSRRLGTGLLNVSSCHGRSHEVAKVIYVLISSDVNGAEPHVNAGWIDPYRGPVYMGS